MTAVLTVFAFVFCQTASALAYGPRGAFAGHNDVRAMGYFHVPLGASQSKKDHAPSFGFTVQRQFQFNDPLYETLSRSYRNTTNLTAEVLDLRFATNGKLQGFDVGGFNAFDAGSRLYADASANNSPRWGLIIGGVILFGVFLWVYFDVVPRGLDDSFGLDKCYPGLPNGGTYCDDPSYQEGS